MLAVLALSPRLSRCHVTERVINSPVGPEWKSPRHPLHTHTHTRAHTHTEHTLTHTQNNNVSICPPEQLCANWPSPHYANQIDQEVWRVGGVCVCVWGGGWWEGTSCPFSFGRTHFHRPCVHYKERFDLNKNFITRSCQETAKALRFFSFFSSFFLHFSPQLYVGLASSSKKLKMLDLPAACSEPHTLSCSWVFTVHFAFPL